MSNSILTRIEPFLRREDRRAKLPGQSEIGREAPPSDLKSGIQNLFQKRDSQLRESYLYYQMISKLFSHFMVMISALNSLQSIQEESNPITILISFGLFFLSGLELLQIESRGDQYRYRWIEFKKIACRDCDDLSTSESRRTIEDWSSQDKSEIPLVQSKREKKKSNWYSGAGGLIGMASSGLSFLEIFTTQLYLVPIFLVTLILSRNYRRWTTRQKRLLRKLESLREDIQGELTPQTLQEVWTFETDLRYLVGE